MAQAKPVPDGHHTLNVSLCVKDTQQAIAFYQKAFGAKLVGRVALMPNGKVGHAALAIGDSTLMLNDEFPDMGYVAPSGPVSSMIFAYFSDVDPVWEKAVAAGAKVVMPLADMFWGDRYGVVVDPFGQRWGLATHKEDLADDEVDARMKKAFSGAK